jgi:hypothetical protein
VAWERLRTIVEELDVEEQVDLWSEKFERFDEAWEGLQWLLCRTPDLKEAMLWGDGTEGYRAYVAAGDPLANTPDIWVVYTFTEAEVVILGVQAVERTTSET